MDTNLWRHPLSGYTKHNTYWIHRRERENNSMSILRKKRLIIWKIIMVQFDSWDVIWWCLSWFNNGGSNLFIHLARTTNNACCMKKWHEGFSASAPGNQNFVSKPFIFLLKKNNNKDWCVWQLERTSTCLITVFNHYANNHSDSKVREERGAKIVDTKSYAFDHAIVRAPAFFRL